ncbi:MAG: class I SAM-dependent methyltransferase [Candidatus Aenigmarchaeota archaeon]|nr:class I SAM-dependent methyltransferase [Candidatus Aenigmarchaeota archaeon]
MTTGIVDWQIIASLTQLTEVIKIEKTDDIYWDEYWKKCTIPSIANDFLSKKLEKLIPENSDIIEIGGSIGSYLAYLNKEKKCKVSCLDFSKKGCELTQNNFNKLGIDGKIYNKDFLGNLSGLPKFDVVYSLGFIEHFTNYNKIIERHKLLCKNNGLIIVGCPNFNGIYKPFIDKKRKNAHVLEAMDIGNWKTNMKTEYVEYIGGLNLGIINGKLSLIRLPLDGSKTSQYVLVTFRNNWLY